MDFQPHIARLDATPIGVMYRESTYWFPLTEVVHLFGLTLLLGAVIAMNLRLLGVGQRRQPPERVVRVSEPLLWIGFWVAVVTGVLMFLSEATKCFYNPAFVVKMGLLIAAVILHLGLHRAAARRALAHPALAKAAATLSLTLWFGVGVAGRAIGLL